MNSTANVYTVGEITTLIRFTLEREIGEVWVEGEISNARQPSSGHWYFTLKDASAQLPAVLFRSDAANQRVCPKDGLMVRVFGRITIFEKGGNYQIIIRQMEESGHGLLMARFEALKEKLRSEGLFDPTRKKKLPLLLHHIGIVTSPSGAAFRDILKVIMQRCPLTHILLAPVRVQGEGAAEEIAQAIELLNRRGGLDVLIVGRGGGSLEDLWPFNEEVVARAIARSRIPIISAVGHEIDFTISDFVADVRAATPTAAAELVAEARTNLRDDLQDLARRLLRATSDQIERAHHRLAMAASSYAFREPRNLLQYRLQQLDSAQSLLKERMQAAVGRARERLSSAVMRIRHSAELKHKTCLQDLARLTAQLSALDPTAVLTRGYSITGDECGRPICSATVVRRGQRVRTLLKDGHFLSDVVATACDSGNPPEDR